MKKIFMTFVILLSLVILPAAAASANEAEIADKFLTTMGIIENDNISEDDVVTRAQFAIYINRFTRMKTVISEKEPYFTDVPESYWAREDILSVCAGGFMQGTDDGRFLPDEPIILNDAARVILNTLGYTNYVDIMGGVDAIAYQADLYDNISEPANMPLTYEALKMLMYNALHAETITVELSGGKTRYVPSGKTMLYDRYKISYTKGVVAANEYLSVDGNRCVAGEIRINNRNYTAASDETDEMVGFNVVCYYTTVNDERYVFAINKCDNKEVTLKFSDIDVVSEDRFIDSENKVYRMNTLTAAIVNNVIADTWQQVRNAIDNHDGYITLIDNNKDNVYDVVNIQSYTDIYVESYDSEAFVVYGKNGEKFDFSVYNDVLIKNKTRIMTKSDIQSGMILSVLIPLTNDYRAKIYVSQDKTTRKIVQKTENNKQLTSDTNEIYNIADTASFAYGDITAGETYDLYLDYYGKIAWIKSCNQRSALEYLISCFAEESGESCKIKIFTSGAEIEAYTVKNKVKIRKSDGTDDTVSDSGLLKLLTGSSGKTQQQFIMYNINSKGELSEIYLLTEDLSKPFHKTPNDENVIKNQYMQVNNNFSCKFVLANTTKVFVVPKPQLNCTDPQYFSIKPTTYITSSASHELSATSRHDMIGVSMPENGFFCDVIGYFYDYSMSVTPGAVTPALVVKMLDAVDDDNEVVKRLECVTMKGETVSYDYYTESDGSVCDISGRTISEGDVLRVAADETGRVSGNSVDTMYDYII